jgi:hypothetical protein
MQDINGSSQSDKSTSALSITEALHTRIARIHEAHLQAIAAGRLPVGHPPLGYRVAVGPDGKGGGVIVGAETGPQMARAFALRLDGLSYLEIGAAVGLDRSRKTWSDMLRNPAYKGVYVFDGAEYAGVIPALVSAAVWQRVQATLRTNRVRAWASVTPYLLSGLLRCRHGYTMSGTQYRRGGQTTITYRCLTRMQHGKAACDVTGAPCAMLDRVVVQQVLHDLRDAPAIAALIARLREQYAIDRVAAELHASAQRISEISAAIERLVELTAVGGLTAQEASRHLTAQERELAFFRRLQAALTAQVPEALVWDTAALTTTLLSIRAQIADRDPISVRNGLRALLSTVTYDRGGVVIAYRLPGLLV